MNHRVRNARRYASGLTLIELLVTITISLFVIAGLNGVVSGALGAKETIQEIQFLQREASFAMERIARTVAVSPGLVLPQANKPATNWPENIREQTLPPSPPVGSSLEASAVLTVLLPRHVDLDFDGTADADNDGDGRFDEDLPQDMNNDGVAGVRGIDDGGDGLADDVNWWDDDEYPGSGDEDPIDGIDNDGDGLTDEDASGDMNGDGSPGIAGVDDDGDGTVDEGNVLDDDEDGNADEDWLDTVTWFMQGAKIVERMPVPWDETGNGSVTGWDYVESIIAGAVTRLRFERVEQPGHPQVDITIEVTGTNGDIVSLNRRVRVGGAL